jgi:hypothetical protein
MKIRYRCPTIDGSPSPGTIIMGDGNRVRFRCVEGEW